MTFARSAGLLFTASLICVGAQTATAQQVPGTAPQVAAGHMPGPQLAPTAAGLKVFYSKFGKYTLSVDAAGSNNAFHTVKVKKPSATAVVDKAYLMAASNNTTTVPAGGVTLDGRPVTWISSVFNDIPPSLPNFFNSVLGDVTSIVKNKVDSRPAGNITFKIAETSNNGGIDGEVLVVVFKDLKLKDKHTIVLMFGGQQLAGDRFEITLNDPINPKAPGARADMGLGISYSFQPAGQYSLITVNGQRISTSAGGQDDGSGTNGALITGGGIGDSRNNPSDPFATDSGGPRTDDEYYNLLPFIKKTDTVIKVDTSNPSNDDNIFFAWFDLSAHADVNKDSDGDGLLDSWEENGYDHDGDGKIDVNLPKLGANKNHKDIFIAYAWMVASASETKSHQPPAAVLKMVTDAFANAPVTNPDGKPGIKMHWKNLGSVPHQDVVDDQWVDFDNIMNPLVSEAEQVIYHRLLNGHMYGSTTSSGLSRGIPASDFMETLGGFSSNPGTNVQRAGTIMHELGHNLGLRHGGLDDENYKPNHLSIMSYANQLVWLLKDGKPFLDYNRFSLKDLDETNLNEKKGLDNLASGGDAAIANYGVRWYSGGTFFQKNTGADKNVDWNGNGTPTNSPVAVDINNSGGQSVLRSEFIEWENIIYDGGSIGASGANGRLKQKRTLPTPPSALKELTAEEFERMQRNTVDVQ
jgi:hypothetical protein